MTRTRVALFIDAENASAKHLPDYLKRCDELGKLTIARCYGGAAGLKKWEKAMAEHHLVPMHTPPGASKENASDFALTIDAVSLLHRGLFDHAVIASSDADFTQLATHIRECGEGTEGMGENKAAKSLQSAFDNFTVVPAAPAKRAPTPKAKPVTPKKSTQKPAIDTKLLLELFQSSVGSGPVTVTEFGKILSAKLPKNYTKGYGNLTSYLEKSGVFKITNGIVSRK
jgi:NYN domain